MKKRLKKKTENKVSEEEEKKDKLIKRIDKKKQEKQIRFFIIGMVALLIFIFISYSFIQATLKFTYAGLEFEKVRQGDLVLYRTPSFPIFLRYDPRDLRDIEADNIMLKTTLGIGGDISLIEGCEDSTIAATSLAIFYGRAGLQTFSVTNDKEQAEKYNITYVDCSLNSPYSTVLFVEGEENKINREGDCYLLEVKNCEMLKVAERFMVASHANSRKIEV